MEVTLGKSREVEATVVEQFGEYYLSCVIVCLFVFFPPELTLVPQGCNFTSGTLFITRNCGVVAQRAGNLNTHTQRFHLATACGLASQGVVLCLYMFQISNERMVRVQESRGRNKTSNVGRRMSATY